MIRKTTGFEPKSKNYKANVNDSFKKQSFLKFIGAKLVDVSPGRIEIEIYNDENLHQQEGFFHGGVTTTIADVSMGYAALSLSGDYSEVLTTEFKVNLLKPAVGKKLIARSEVIKFGNLLKVCQSSVYCVSEKNEESLCAFVTGTMYVK
tara:strand:- start:148 stop:594 length:447 start_codon:yes stop_codon:yes gene_type:complete